MPSREYMRAYKAANRDRIKHLNRAWKDRNREKVRAQSRASRHRIYWGNPEAGRRKSREYWERKRARDPQGVYERERDRRYGLLPGDYDALIARQHGCCAVCEKPLGIGHDAAIEHDHAIGMKRHAVRGIVHARCNSLVAVVENNRWTGAAYRHPSVDPSTHDPYNDLLMVGRFIARPKPFADITNA